MITAAETTEIIKSLMTHLIADGNLLCIVGEPLEITVMPSRWRPVGVALKEAEQILQSNKIQYTITRNRIRKPAKIIILQSVDLDSVLEELSEKPPV